MGSVLRVHTSRWVFECGIGGFARQRVFAIQSQSTGVLGIFLLFYVRGRVHKRFFVCSALAVSGDFWSTLQHWFNVRGGILSLVEWLCDA